MSGYRALGDGGARLIETALQLPQGYFDDPKETVYGIQNTAPAPDIRQWVPLISWIQAGNWGEVPDGFSPEDQKDWLPCPASCSKRTFALRVQGDSMTAPHGRSYPEGAYIYCDPEQRGGVVSGDLVIAKLNGSNQTTFKMLVEAAGQYYLKPLNPQYPLIKEEFCILAKVVGMFVPE